MGDRDRGQDYQRRRRPKCSPGRADTVDRKAGQGCVPALRHRSLTREKGGRWEEIRIKMLIRRSRLFDRPNTSISGADMAEWRDRRLCKVSSSTVNRELCLISSMFTHAMKEWRVGLTLNPCALITKPRKPRPRTQRVSMSDRKTIIAKLGWDGTSEPATSAQWVAFAFFIALETAMRKGGNPVAPMGRYRFRGPLSSFGYDEER